MRRPWRTTAWSSASRTRITLGPPAAPWCRRRASSRRSASRRARSRAPPSTSARAAGRAPPGPSGSKPQPSSATLSTSRSPPFSSLHRRSAWRRRGGARCRAPPGRSAAPASPDPAASRGTSRTRRSIVWPGHPPQHLDVLAQHGREPLGLQRAGPQLEHHRAQLLHRAARELGDPLAAPPPRRRGRASSSVDADSAASATPNSRCVTESCSSRASRLRSSTMLSSRLRSCSRAFSIAIAACAASSSISFWSASRELGPSSFSVRYSAPITSPRATIGTPRNERICGCARGHQPRKRGSAADVVGPVRLGRVQHRAEHPVRARERAHRLDQLVAHPGRDEARERALAVRDPERRVARAGRARARSARAAAARARPRARTAIASTTSESARKAVQSAAAMPPNTLRAARRRRPIGRWS